MARPVIIAARNNNQAVCAVCNDQLKPSAQIVRNMTRAVMSVERLRLVVKYHKVASSRLLPQSSNITRVSAVKTAKCSGKSDRPSNIGR